MKLHFQNLKLRLSQLRLELRSFQLTVLEFPIVINGMFDNDYPPVEHHVRGSKVQDQ